MPRYPNRMFTTEMEELAQKLRQIRKKKAWSQHRLGLELRITGQSVYRYEKCLRRADWRIERAILEIYKSLDSDFQLWNPLEPEPKPTRKLAR